jgi:FkbM family methyltransferase
MPNLLRIAAEMNVALLRTLIARLPAGSRSWLAGRVLADRYDPRTRALAGFFEHSVLAWKNKRYAVAQNGEADLLRRLSAFQPRLLLDVGANEGDWAIAACRAISRTMVHCFEISAETADHLTANIASAGLAERVTVHRIGLGARQGEIPLFVMPESNTETSTLRFAAEFAAASQSLSTIVETSARVTTGDAFLAEHGIEHVDLVKIDVEGAEFSVLEGFAEALKRGAVDMFQFEYGPLNLGSRKLLADFYELFIAHGFQVGKIYPEGVAFKPYELADEDFVGPNYFACHQRRADIIEALCCPPLTPL